MQKFCQIFAALRHNALLQMVGTALSLALILFTVSIPAAAPAKAATCGGQIVVATGVVVSPQPDPLHFGIAIRYSNPRGLNAMPIEAVWLFTNGKWVYIPNGDKGVDYGKPLQKLGNAGFVYGVSKTWIATTWGAPIAVWNAANWKVYYTC